MSCLKFLARFLGYGKKKTDPQSIVFHDYFVEISGLGLFAQFDQSNSGEWALCWRDSDNSGTGGNRNLGKGSFVVYNKKLSKVVCQGSLERPNGGKISDNGNFSIEDWHFGNALSGTFYVFSSNGEQLVKRKFEANLLNSAISQNGLIAVCQTANSPSEDGNRLTAFDVLNGVELFSIHPKTGWADEYVFIESDQKVGVVINGVGEFYYSTDGFLIDPGAFDKARLDSDRYEVVLMAAEEFLKSPELNPSVAEIILQAAIRALSIGADHNDSWKAVSYKIQGLAHEYLENNHAAIDAFEKALQINPKIGVKRKADQLRKKL